MIDLIINPIAGGERGAKSIRTVTALKEFLSERGIKHALHYSSGRGNATAIARELSNGEPTTIVVVGGDGTLHEVINGIENFENVTVGLIPCGTGNDFATTCGLPFDPIKAMELILNNPAKPTDFMQMPTVRGINVIGMGLDVQVLKRYSQLKKKTKTSYTSCLIKTLINFDYSDFNATLNGKTTHLRSFIAAVANGSCFGGGLSICPDATPFDGKLDFVAVKEMFKLKIIHAFIKLKAGKVLSLKETVHEQTEHIKVESETPFTVNVDGELYENIPFEVWVVSNKLMFHR